MVLPQLTGTASTHSASPESKLDGIEVSHRTPHFSNQALLCHVDVAQVQGVVNRLHLPHFDEPDTDVFSSCLQNPLAMILRLVQHLSEKQEEDEAKSWTEVQGAPTSLSLRGWTTSLVPRPRHRLPHACSLWCTPILISSAERLKGFFQGCFLIIFLLQLQGQRLFQTTNCAKITENNFTSTQVKRAEKSSESEGFSALRKQITLKYLFTEGKWRKCFLLRVFSNWNISNSGQVRFPEWKVLDCRESEDTRQMQLTAVTLLLSSCLI